MKENDKIAKAQKQLEEILSDPEVRREEAKTLEVLDFNCALERGKKENKLEIAKKMLTKNKPIEEIIEFTDLTQEEIKKLQKDKEQDKER